MFLAYLVVASARALQLLSLPTFDDNAMFHDLDLVHLKIEHEIRLPIFTQGDSLTSEPIFGSLTTVLISLTPRRYHLL